MKKIILSLCLAGITFFCGYSQMNLTLSDSLGALPNDTTIVRTGVPTPQGEIESFIFVKNNSAGTMSVKVRKVELSLIRGTLNYFCWGLCYQNTVYVSLDSINIRSGETNKLDFSGHYTCQDSIGVSTIRYVFFDKDHLSDTVCVNVQYDVRLLGIDNILTRNNSTITAYPNPADSYTSFVYKLAQGTSSSVIVRNILGVVVKEINLNDPEGKITVNTSDLGDGIYFYSLIDNGFSKSTRKLVVKH